MAILRRKNVGWPAVAVSRGKIQPLRKKKRTVVWMRDSDGLWVVCPVCRAINLVPRNLVKRIGRLGSSLCGVRSKSPGEHWYLGCVICRECKGHVFYTLVGPDPRDLRGGTER